jgi:ElaB/YqjD/DUF883 family membrane-anchored ribosome-binding protein
MTTAEANERLVKDLRAVVSDAEELLKATAGQAGEKLTEVRSRLAAALESAKDTYDNLEGKTAEAARATDRCIRDHPYETVGVAFGLGLLLGFLFRSK